VYRLDGTDVRAKNVLIKGPRVTIRPLRKQDLDVMSGWDTFEDPLYRLFDWPRRSSVENGLWYADLVRDRRRVYYAVDDEWQTVIGRISLREIRRRESSRLGIGFGEQYVSQGYGSEALLLFLRYYFRRLGFERMVLDVAAINLRALRLYERCGFERVGSSYEPLPYQADIGFLNEDAYRHLRKFVRQERWRDVVLTYDMALERDDWLAKQRNVAG
jgi:RimJ/RimL family protein N-acetyltransferase